MYVETTSARRAVCPSVHHLVSAAKTSDRCLNHLVQDFLLDKLVFRENRLRGCLTSFDLLVFATVFLQIRSNLLQETSIKIY
jgi:hypothetical protein